MATTKFTSLYTLLTAFVSTSLSIALYPSQASSLSTFSCLNGNSVSSNSSSEPTLQTSAQKVTIGQYQILLHCGNMYLNKNDIKHALLFFKRAYETTKDPYGKKILADNIGLLLYEKNQFKEAIAYLEEARASKIQTESQIDPTLLLGMALFNMKDYEQAFSHLTQACNSQNPINKASAHIHLGSLFLHGLGQQQDADEACKHFEKALKQEFVPDGIIQRRCYHSFYLAALLQVQAADKLYQEAQTLPLIPPQEVLKKIKQAYVQLEKARATKKERIDPDLEISLEDEIATIIGLVA